MNKTYTKKYVLAKCIVNYIMHPSEKTKINKANKWTHLICIHGVNDWYIVYINLSPPNLNFCSAMV